MNKVRVLIVDDHVIVRDGVRMILEAQPDVEIVGEAETGAQAVALAQSLKPDVVVLATGAMYRFPLESIVPRVLAAKPGWLKALFRWPAFKQLFYSVMRKPDVRLERRIRALGVDVRRIGDCSRPRKTPEAMTDAMTLAYRL